MFDHDSHVDRLGYWVKFDVSPHSLYMFQDELELATIQDSKLARRLYKNQIDRIKDGKIWLK